MFRKRMENLEKHLGYNEFKYPEEFLKIIELNLMDYDRWYIMSEKHVLSKISGLKKRYPNRKLIPFARRVDNNDVACFEIGKEGVIQIIQDFALSGHEQLGQYTNFWLWFQESINELIEFNKRKVSC